MKKLRLKSLERFLIFMLRELLKLNHELRCIGKLGHILVL